VKRRRNEVDRAKWKERRNDSDGERGGERITHNLTEGRGADPAKKAAAQLFFSAFCAASTLSVLLFAMLILALKLNFAAPRNFTHCAVRKILFRKGKK